MFRKNKTVRKICFSAACATTAMLMLPVSAWSQSAVPGRYIVVFADDAAADWSAGSTVTNLAESIQSEYGGEIVQTYRHALFGMAIDLSTAAVEALKSDYRIASVTPDWLGTIIATQPNPTWGLDRIDQRTLPLDNSYTYPDSAGADVHVYVLDTGLDLDHPEFSGRVVPGLDYLDSDLVPEDPCSPPDRGAGHGTHVAGIIGSTTYGVAKEVTIHPLRVCDCAGFCPQSLAIAAIDDVTAYHNPPAVVNMSLRWSGSLPGIGAIDTAVNNSIAAGVTYAVAAGNDNLDACNYTPARIPDAVTVAAVNDTDARWSWNVSQGSNYGTCVDLFAPGEDVESTYLAAGTATLTGTSMASPHVAGAAALLLGEDSTGTPATVTAEILAAATPDVVIDPAGSPNLLLFVGEAVDADLRVQYMTYSTNVWESSPSVNLRIYNDGAGAVDLADVEAKFYYIYEGMGQTETVNIYWAGIQPSGTYIAPYVNTDLQAVGADHIITYSVDAAAGALQPGEYVEIQSRFNKSDWSNYYQPNDYSFGYVTVFQDWTYVTGYVDGTLVWGTEP